MPAPDLETLFDIETAVEAAVKTILTEANIPAFTPREIYDLPARRVDVQLTLGDHTGNKMLTPAGDQAFRTWNALLSLQVSTPRKSNPNANPPRLDSDHRNFRAKIRILMQRFSGKLANPTLLPYHAVTMITDAGTSPNVVTDDDCDVSELSMNCVISIKSDAWPTG